MPRKKKADKVIEGELIAPDDSKAIEGEIITREQQEQQKLLEEQARVADMAAKLAPADYMADELGLTVEEFVVKHGELVKRTINKITTEMSNVMVSKALGYETNGDVKSAAWLLDRLGWSPAGIQVHGALNQNNPIVTQGEIEGQRKPVVSKAMAKLIKADNGRKKGKGA